MNRDAFLCWRSKEDQDQFNRWVARDEKGDPLYCKCGQPVGDDYPMPSGTSPLCYFCSTEYFHDAGWHMPVERKSGEIGRGDDIYEMYPL